MTDKLLNGIGWVLFGVLAISITVIIATVAYKIVINTF